METALQAGEPWERFIPCAQYEETVGLGELSLALAEELSRLEPFGEGNPEPAFRTDGRLCGSMSRCNCRRKADCIPQVLIVYACPASYQFCSYTITREC